MRALRAFPTPNFNSYVNAHSYQFFFSSNRLISTCYGRQKFFFPNKSMRTGFERTLLNEQMQVHNDAKNNVPKDESLHADPNFAKVVQDLNSLQSKSRELAIAKYRDPRTILPLLAKQLKLVGIQQCDLEKLNVIHVSGTKGKGSVCAFTENILQAHNLKTGFYNSPHLIKVTERIRINGRPIDDAKFVKYFRDVFDVLKSGTRREGIEMPNYFSFLTILAFHSFIKEKVDCAIMEVGIGGEYDPTNVIERPIACGITTLDFDHTSILGNTLESIAWNKAGIIKREVPVFTVEHEQSSVFKVIEERANAQSAPIFVCERLNYPSLPELGIKSSVQYINAALACHMSSYMLNKIHLDHRTDLTVENSGYLKIVYENMTPEFMNGLKECSWSGRCQIVERSNKTFFLDGAHTEKSMRNCLEWFSQASESHNECVKRILMVNVIGDRDKASVLSPLLAYEKFNHVLFTTNRVSSESDCPSSATFAALGVERSFDNARTNASVWMNMLNLEGRDHSNVLIKPHIKGCMDFITELSTSNPDNSYHILTTGSLHFVGAVLGILDK